LFISTFTRRTLWSALCVYARKRIAGLSESHTVKLLI
jgi:hypothetical protein